MNGFGHMILSKNQTNPKYSFGKTRKFFTVEQESDLILPLKKKCGEVALNFGRNNIGKKKKSAFSFSGGGEVNKHNNTRDLSLSDCNENNLTLNKSSYKNPFISNANRTTDFLYNPKPVHYYKYPTSPKFSFSKAKKCDFRSKTLYNFYTNKYDPKTDGEKIGKKWDRIVGGFIATGGKFSEENSKFYDKYTTPGPGRYNPKYLYFKYPQHRIKSFGAKTKLSLSPTTSTPVNIAPGSYNTDMKLGAKTNNFKFADAPKFKFGTGKRREIAYGDNFLGENNYQYSSLGEQVMTQKSSSPGYSLGREKRFRKIYFK